MEPQLSYARTADAVSIGWTSLGSGPPLVVLPPVPFSNLLGEWRIPLLRSVYTRLAESFRLVLYDGRGTGSSQREVADLSAEAMGRDLDAVLRHAGIEQAALLAIYAACSHAVAFAADQPDRVTHLILFGASGAGGKSLDAPGTPALFSLMERDWDLFVETAALAWMGWSVGDAGRLGAESFRSSTTPDNARKTLAAFANNDVAPLLGRVAAPALVLHRQRGRQVPLEESTRLAAALPDGRLHVLEGESATLFFEDPDEVLRVIGDFLGRQAGRGVVAPRSPLTPREQEVLRLIASGETNAEIAGHLALSVHTVERHAANLYRKIGARGRADATAFAIRNGIG